MANDKDQESREDAQWQQIAASKGYVCAACGTIVPKAEYPVWAKTNHCGACDHKLHKDD